MMAHQQPRPLLVRFFSEYRMVLVLLGLCAFFSFATMAEQHPTGATASQHLAVEISQKAGTGSRVLVVVGPSAADATFAESLNERLTQASLRDVATVRGKPD